MTEEKKTVKKAATAIVTLSIDDENYVALIAVDPHRRIDADGKYQGIPARNEDGSLVNLPLNLKFIGGYTKDGEPIDTALLEKLAEKAGERLSDRVRLAEPALTYKMIRPGEVDASSTLEIDYMHAHLGEVRPVHLKDLFKPDNNCLAIAIVKTGQVARRPEGYFVVGEIPYLFTQRDPNIMTGIDIGSLYQGRVPMFTPKDADQTTRLTSQQLSARNSDAVPDGAILNDCVVPQLSVSNALIPTIEEAEEINAALRDIARQHVIPFAGNPQGSKEKENGGGQQTQHDVDTEAALKEFLQSKYPGAKVIGEEGVSDDASALSEVNDPGIVFVVDPIDGTRDFAAGGTKYNIMVSMRRDGVNVGSWIYFPATDEIYFALKGQGIFVDKQGHLERCPISKKTPEHDTKTIVLNGLRGGGTAEQNKTLSNTYNLVTRSAWVAGYDVIQLVRGEAHGVVWSKGKFNDILPWEGFLNELGYSVTDLSGKLYNSYKPDAGVVVIRPKKSLTLAPAA